LHEINTLHELLAATQYIPLVNGEVYIVGRHGHQTAKCSDGMQYSGPT